MRVLITRPREDGERLARRLAGAGIEVVLAPVMDICFRTNEMVVLDNVQAVLLTSANGARSLAATTSARDIPILAVGEATAETASGFGFKAVTSAGGDVESLADTIIATCNPAGAPRLQLVERRVLYDAVPIAALSEEAFRALETGPLDAALFFSPRTAEAFVSLARSGGLVECCRRLDALCLSEAVAARLSGSEWRRVLVSPRPDQEALLELMGIDFQG
jgi:uroporphyrinogen-III synthase